MDAWMGRLWSFTLPAREDTGCVDNHRPIMIFSGWLSWSWYYQGGYHDHGIIRVVWSWWQCWSRWSWEGWRWFCSISKFLTSQKIAPPYSLTHARIARWIINPFTRNANQWVGRVVEHRWWNLGVSFGFNPLLFLTQLPPSDSLHWLLGWIRTEQTHVKRIHTEVILCVCQGLDFHIRWFLGPLVKWPSVEESR